MDIVPVCAHCHQLIHDVHRKHPHRGLWWALKGARTLTMQSHSELTIGPYGPGNLTFEPIGAGAYELIEQLEAKPPAKRATQRAPKRAGGFAVRVPVKKPQTQNQISRLAHW